MTNDRPKATDVGGLSQTITAATPGYVSEYLSQPIRSLREVQQQQQQQEAAPPDSDTEKEPRQEEG